MYIYIYTYYACVSNKEYHEEIIGVSGMKTTFFLPSSVANVTMFDEWDAPSYLKKINHSPMSGLDDAQIHKDWFS